MSIFGFGPSAKVEIQLTGQEERSLITVESEEKKEELPIYSGDDVISGIAKVIVPSGKKLDHVGIKIELIGAIELYYDRSNGSEFTALLLELATPGQLTETTEFPFEFTNVEKQFESYNGLNVHLRYYIRCTVSRNYSSNITKEREFWVQATSPAPEINNTIKMEVGIEECLHIEFEYDKAKYHLKDVVIGKIYFLLVRIKIKHMEVTVIKRETTGQGPSASTASDTVTKFEIMDGAPVRGESIPVRLFLEGYPLTPTYRSVNNLFSVRYYLNLVLVDEEDRRYFKQQEITLWRKDIG